MLLLLELKKLVLRNSNFPRNNSTRLQQLALCTVIKSAACTGKTLIGYWVVHMIITWSYMMRRNNRKLSMWSPKIQRLRQCSRLVILYSRGMKTTKLSKIIDFLSFFFEFTIFYMWFLLSGAGTCVRRLLWNHLNRTLDGWAVSEH